MSGGRTGSGILEQALAKMPFLVSTSEEGPPTDLDLGIYKIPGRPPPDDAEYLPQLLKDPCEAHYQSEPESEEWFDSRAEWFNQHEEEDLNCYTE